MEADPAGVAVRFLLFLVLSLLFGLPAFVVQAPPQDRRAIRGALRLGRVAPVLAAFGLFLSSAQLVLLTAAMTGSDPAGVDRGAVVAVLSSGALGWAWMARMLALVVVLLGSIAWRGRLGSGLMTAGGAAIPLGSLAWAGHGIVGDGADGWLHLTADIMHLLAAGAWLGALVGLTLLVARPARTIARDQVALAGRAATSFARTGTLIVLALVATGAINLATLVGATGLRELPSTPYGRLLVVKLLLFAAMLGLAAANRFRFAPAIRRRGEDDGAVTLARLRTSLAFETACLVAILALVGWLGMLPPSGVQG